MGALDEMFSQGEPVLAGVDLETNYLFLVDKRGSRTTEDWKTVLDAGKARGLHLETVVRDGGAAIAAGTTAVFSKAKQSDDNLHEPARADGPQERRGAASCRFELVKCATNSYDRSRLEPNDGLSAALGGDETGLAMRGRRSCWSTLPMH